jgi:lysophospholipase L1-like esterase
MAGSAGSAPLQLESSPVDSVAMGAPGFKRGRRRCEITDADGGSRRGPLAAGALLIASLLVSLLIAESVLRLRFDEVDYLQPELASHPVLPVVVSPGSAGHDALGFRNRAVPGRVDVLAIGDSQTYGLSATRQGSWPAWLSRLTARSVYSLALGGYGPAEYAYLLRTHAPHLQPRVAIVALYLGNDLLDAARPRSQSAVRQKKDERLLGPVRTWLSRHSLLYQITKHEIPGLAAAARHREATLAGDALVLLESGAVETAFHPEIRLQALELARPRVREGMGRTLELLEELQGDCRRLEVDCLFVLIPTKESVYWEIARDVLPKAQRQRMQAVVRAESGAREELVDFLARHGMRFADALPALRAAADRTPLYPANQDGHPLRQGYRVIAEVVRGALEDPAPTGASLAQRSRF